MTIHDILCSCGSVHAETTIFIIESGITKKICQFKNLESRYEKLQFRFFTITALPTATYSSYLLAFKFYV